MIKNNEETKREEFKKILFALAKDQNTLEDAAKRVAIYKNLESIYYEESSENFRHYYTDIFTVITMIDADKELGSLDILAQNMQIIKDGYKKNINSDDNGNNINIEKEIMKLYDHTNLDISRINYTKAMNNEARSEQSKVKLLLAAFDKKIEDAQHKFFETSNDMKKSQQEFQKQNVTILGIFAAIVLAFTGGIAFSTSVLENIAKASPCRLGLVVVGLAFVLINVVYILTRFIQEINSTSNEKVKYPCYMKVLNGICGCAILFIMWAWYNNVVGIVRASR